MRLNPFTDITRKKLPVDRQGAARRDPGSVSCFHEEGPETAQLFLEQPDGVFQGFSAQGIGTDEFGKTGQDMGR